MNLLNNDISFWLKDVEGVVYPAGSLFEICCPARFDQVELTLKRDEVYFGIQDEFSDGEIDLEFGGEKENGLDTGKAFLKAVFFTTKGVDGLVSLHIKNGATEIYNGMLLGKSFKIDSDKGLISLRLKGTYFEEKLRTRWDTVLNVQATESLDGGTIDGVAEYDIILESFSIRKNTRAIVHKPKPNVFSVTYSVTDDNYALSNINPRGWSMIPIFDKVEKQEIGTFFNYEGGNMRWLSGSGSPADADLDVMIAPDDFDRVIGTRFYNFKNETKGDEVIVGDFTLKYNFTVEVLRQSAGTSQLTEFQVIPWLIIGQDDPDEVDTFLVREQIKLSEIDQTGLSLNFTDTSPAIRTADIDVTQSNIKLLANEQVYFIITARIDCTTLNKQIRVTNNSGTFEFVAQTVQQPTKESGVKWFELMDKAIEIMTGQSGRLQSNLLDRVDRSAATNGDFYNNLVINGYRTRHSLLEDLSTRNIEVKFSDLMEFLNFQMFAGYSVEKDANGNDYVTIERAMNYFKDIEVLKLSDPFDMKITSADDMIYNEAEFAYSKVIDEQINTLDDIHTKQELLLPINQIKRKYRKESPVYQSGYIIEHTRRQQFAEEQTSSWDYDDDIFNICTIKKNVYNGVTIVGNTDQNYMDIRRESTGGGIAHFLFDSEFTIASSTSYNGTYTIDRAFYTVDSSGRIVTRVYVNEAVPATASETGNVTMDTILEVPETNEAFSSVSGIYDDTTAYNLRHSLKDAFLNHSPMLMSSVHHKPVTKVVKTTFTKNNQIFERTFDSGEDYSTIDPDLTTIGYKDDLAIEDIGDYKFIPQWIECSHRLNYDQYNLLRNNRYGYISVWDVDSQSYIKGYIWTVKKNPILEKVDFKLLRKR